MKRVVVSFCIILLTGLSLISQEVDVSLSTSFSNMSEREQKIFISGITTGILGTTFFGLDFLDRFQKENPQITEEQLTCGRMLLELIASEIGESPDDFLAALSLNLDSWVLSPHGKSDNPTYVIWATLKKIKWNDIQW